MSLSKSMVLLWLGGVLLVLLVASPVAKVHAVSDEEEENSSSEVTVEASDEDGSQAFSPSPIPSPQRRRRRSPGLEEFQSLDGSPRKANVARAIPGLPDIGALIKVAEFLRTVGEQIVPILIEGTLKLNPSDNGGANSQPSAEGSTESAENAEETTARDGLLLSVLDGFALRNRQRLVRFFGILRDVRRDARKRDLR